MIVFAADLHLSPIVWQDLPQASGDAIEAWHQILNYCSRDDVSALILGGDIFDKTRPDSASIEAFAQGINSLPTNVQVFAVQGQHDRATPPWPVACTDRVTMLSSGLTDVIKDGDKKVRIKGYDQMPADQLQNLLRHDADCEKPYDILVVHQLASQFVPFEGAWDFDAEWAPPFVKLILAGDYHAPVNEGRLWYSGSTHARGVDQTGERSFLTVSYGGDEPSVSRVPLRSRPWKVLSINTEEELEAAIADLPTKDETLPAAIATPAVLAQYDIEVAGVASRLKDACEEAGCLLRMSPLRAATMEAQQSGAASSGQVTLEDCLGQLVDREKDSEFYSFMLSLLTSPDPRGSLVSERGRRGL